MFSLFLGGSSNEALSRHSPSCITNMRFPSETGLTMRQVLAWKDRRGYARKAVAHDCYGLESCAVSEGCFREE